MRVTWLVLAGMFGLAACGSGDDGAANSGSGITLQLGEPEPLNEAIPANAAAENVVEAQANAVEPVNTVAPAEDEDEARANQATEVEPEPAPRPKQEPPKPDAAADAAPSEARLPVSREQAARTIDRIGFTCGEISSASRVEGGGEDATYYKITCSSGDVYQGTSRDGRFRFRPWTGKLTRD